MNKLTLSIAILAATNAMVASVIAQDSSTLAEITSVGSKATLISAIEKRRGSNSPYFMVPAWAGINGWDCLPLLRKIKARGLKCGNISPMVSNCYIPFDNGGESDGCVYDEENRTLSISEEEMNGVFRAYPVTEALDFSNPVIIDSREGNIGGDPEGVTLYKTSATEGYIILSS
jgi:hypothetical protein